MGKLTTEYELSFATVPKGAAQVAEAANSAGPSAEAEAADADAAAEATNSAGPLAEAEAADAD